MTNRMGTNNVSIVAAATPVVLWATSVGAKSVLKKLRILNRQLAPVFVDIGYTTLGAVFVPVMPRIFVVNGIDMGMTEVEIPLCGNAMDGFIADATAVTGTLGYISVQASAAAAAPLDVQVSAEIEES